MRNPYQPPTGLPSDRAQASIEASTGGEEASPQGQASYALAVFLFAPVAVVVPLTISTAVGAATIVGERERGTGEFLAHSPADVREIYMGKLLASLIPGYITTAIVFAYAKICGACVARFTAFDDTIPTDRAAGAVTAVRRTRLHAQRYRPSQARWQPPASLQVMEVRTWWAQYRHE